ncbi:hypothetical protein [Labrenzia sp. 011]|uniref:hypothetical protein n=1 Tax=Labrenzia sp. 011 TaxID=2171494 RepID=UPI001057429A|nr:hypothetical protein [Labrenzia sp. 011]
MHATISPDRMDGSDWPDPWESMRCVLAPTHRFLPPALKDTDIFGMSESIFLQLLGKYPVVAGRIFDEF